MYLSPLAISELRRMVEESEITKEDDAKWPKKNVVGKQELEIRLGKDHISFEVSQRVDSIGFSMNLSKTDRENRLARRYSGL
jgi:hypothetical protein